MDSTEVIHLKICSSYLVVELTNIIHMDGYKVTLWHATNVKIKTDQ